METTVSRTDSEVDYVAELAKSRGHDEDRVEQSLARAWEDYNMFEPVIKKVTAKWCVNFGGRFNFLELESEAITVYVHVHFIKDLEGHSNSGFCGVLYRSINNHFSTMARRNQKRAVNLEEIQVASRNNVFDKMMADMQTDDLKGRLQGDGLELLNTLCSKIEVIEEAHTKRLVEIGRGKYQSKLSKEDVGYYFIKVQGWAPARYKRAIVSVSRVLDSELV